MSSSSILMVKVSIVYGMSIEARRLGRKEIQCTGCRENVKGIAFTKIAEK